MSVLSGQQIHLITYASGRFKGRSSYYNNEVAKNSCFKTVKVFDESDLTSSFKRDFGDILCLPRGAGYWIWKLNIIQQTLDRVSEGDIIIYMDSGCSVNINDSTTDRFYDYIDLVNQHDMVRFEIAHKEYAYTNKATIQYFQEKYNLQKEHVLSNMIGATIIPMKKCPRVVKFFNEFESVLRADRFLITDKYNGDRLDGFIDHRHDQSILSLLSKVLKVGYIIPDETYYEDWGRGSHIPILATRQSS